MVFDASSIAGTNEQKAEWYYNQIVSAVPSLENTPALLYGDKELMYYRLLNDGSIIPSVSESFVSTLIQQQMDERLAAIEAIRTASELAFEIRVKALEDSAFNVLNYGAIADATDANQGTDNTLAFQTAMDLAWGSFGQGGVMLVSPGSYRLHSSVQIRSNVIVLGYGAIIRKYVGNSSYSSFQAMSNGASGYGSSASNFTFEGFTFQGSYTGYGTGCGNAVTLHHAKDATFRKCTWTQAMISGHCVDMMGCDGILIDNCVVKGFNPGSTKQYTEAFQVDYSLIGSGGSDTVFDGLPTVNVTVQDCKFLPLTIGGTTYAAPNPLGSHQRISGQWFDNIKFLNNYVEYGMATDILIPDGFGALTRGWLHFFCARNIEIRGNTFKNTSGLATRIVNLYPISTGYLMADVNNPNAVTVSMPVMAAQNVTITGNTFDGFNSTVSESIIDIRGTNTTDTNGRNIKIINNTFKNSFPTTGISATNGSDPIYMQDCVGITLEDNYVYTGRSLCYFFRCRVINITGGHLNDLGYFPGRFSTSTDITISNVHVEGYGQGWWFYSTTTGIDYSGGSLTNARADGINKFHFTFNAVSEFNVHNIRLPFVTGWKGVEAYGTSTKGKVKDVFATGHVNDAGFATINANSAVALTVDY